jgi:hypothetical protein
MKSGICEVALIVDVAADADGIPLPLAGRELGVGVSHARWLMKETLVAQDKERRCMCFGIEASELKR